MMRSCWFLLVLLVLSARSSVARPNIVMFLADDAGVGDYSSSGNRQVRTPNIDSLAQQGASLERFYVCAVCSPTRAEMLTGRYHVRTGAVGVSEGMERINLNEKTLPDALQAAGYVTGNFGKWHNGSQWPYHPLARGFSEYYGFTSGHWGEYVDPPLEHNGQPIRAKGYLADVVTTAAIGFITENRSKPFFSLITFNTPHTPWCAPQQDWERLKNRPITQRGAQGDAENIDQTRCALAMMENQDYNVGRVLETLQTLGLAENTLVIYFSDNGPNTLRWVCGLRGKKGTLDEGGLRSVCFWRWPGKIPAGRKIPQMTAAIDFLPTLAHFTQSKPLGTEPLDGRNLSDLLTNTASGEKWPDRELFSHFQGKTALRTQQYLWLEKGGLYDLEADPGQSKDLAATQREVAAAMRAKLTKMKAELIPQPSLLKSSRPFPVGYTEFPLTMLPARDGQPHGGVKRSSGAPNCSYFVNWTALEDAITWKVEIAQSGSFAVELLHTSPQAAVGAEIELAGPGGRLTATLEKAWDPPLYTNQDTLPRPSAESPMKEFRIWEMGKIKLTKGIGELKLRALKIPGGKVADIRQIQLRRLED